MDRAQVLTIVKAFKERVAPPARSGRKAYPTTSLLLNCTPRVFESLRSTQRVQ